MKGREAKSSGRSPCWIRTIIEDETRPAAPRTTKSKLLESYPRILAILYSSGAHTVIDARSSLIFMSSRFYASPKNVV